MIEELNIEERHEGLIFLYEAKDHQAEMNHFHRHSELEMNIVIKGSAEYNLRNQRYNLKRGSIVWLFPGQDHKLSNIDPQFKMYVVVFKESLFKKPVFQEDKYQILTEQDPDGSFCKKISLSSIEKLEMVCSSICEFNLNSEVISPAYYYAGQAFGF